MDQAGGNLLNMHTGVAPRLRHAEQVVAAIGNSNINVGGRTINFGQQSVNIRGVGLLDSGGAQDLTQGWRVSDIENIVLTQSNSVPVQVKDVAHVHVGNVPRLGKAGRDQDESLFFWAKANPLACERMACTWGFLSMHTSP